MNVLQKLNKVRFELQKRQIKKSGLNKFAGFKYYELSDFLPTLNELNLENGITTNFFINNSQSVLRIYNSEKFEEFIEFSSHTIMATMKGANPIQELGASHTYMRRFLMLMAFEISDGDIVDSIKQESHEEEFSRINAFIELSELVPEEKIPALLKHYGISQLGELSDEQLKNAINMKKSKK